MPAGDPRFPGLSVEDQSQASWLADVGRASDEGSQTESFHEVSFGNNPQRLSVLVELVKADLVRKWSSGQPVSLEFYLDVLPELGTRDTIPAELILAEYEERCRRGVPMGLPEYAERFPLQAGTLRQLIERSHDGVSGLIPSDRAGQLGPSACVPPSTGLPSVVPIRLPKQFGRYRIIKKLGQGAMGTVYLAHDSQLDRRVALKVPHVRPGRDVGDGNSQELNRFYREVRTAATLRHPNLCPVYDQGEIGGVYYVTMAYLKGRPLSALIDRQRPLSERWVAAAVRKIARALSEAHSRGVIHRDLKPSNIMVVTRSELVIMDFGLAWRAGTEDARLTQSGTILGTPAYMSPEQLSGNMTAIGPKCDIYSLGVIFYELLTARRPFQGPTAAVMAQILFNDPQPPSVHRPDLDPRIEAICLKAMAKKGEDRYSTMGELAAALGRYLRGHAGTTRSRLRLPDPLDAVDTVAPDATAQASAPPEPLVDPIPCADPPLPDDQPEVSEPGDRQDQVSVNPTATVSTPGDEVAPFLGGNEPHPERPMGVGLAGNERAGAAGPPDADSELRIYWRAWMAVVERFALRRNHRRVEPEVYKSLHGGLIRACRSRVEVAEEVKRPFYEHLVDLVQPWLTLKLLEHSDREILFDLLICCREADLELHGLPQAARNLRDQITTLRESAERPMSAATRFWFALGTCLLFMIAAFLILASW